MTPEDTPTSPPMDTDDASKNSITGKARRRLRPHTPQTLEPRNPDEFPPEISTRRGRYPKGSKQQKE